MRLVTGQGCPFWQELRQFSLRFGVRCGEARKLRSHEGMDWEFGIEESLGTGLPLAFVLFMAPTVAFTAHRRCAGGQGGQPEGDVPKDGMNLPAHRGLPAGALL